MAATQSLVVRIAVGKIVGLLFGIAGFILLPYFLPDASWQLRWGILLWYATMGAVIGMFGVFNHHPVLKLPLPWWFRAPLVGGWLNFVLVFFAYDEMRGFMLTVFGLGSPLASPFWFVLEGALVGLVIGFCATRAGGEGREIVDA